MRIITTKPINVSTELDIDMAARPITIRDTITRQIVAVPVEIAPANDGTVWDEGRA